MESSTDEARFNAAGKTSVAEAGSSVVQEATDGSAHGTRAQDNRHVATPFRGTAAVMQSLAHEFVSDEPVVWDRLPSGV